jgi:hypothetical protein
MGYVRLVRQLLAKVVRTDIVNADGEKAEACALNESIAKLIKSAS